MKKFYSISTILPLALILLLISHHKNETESIKNNQARTLRKKMNALPKIEAKRIESAKIAAQKSELSSLEVQKIERLEKVIDQQIKELKNLIAEETKHVLAEPVDHKKVNSLRKQRASISQQVKEKLKIHQKLTWMEMKKINPYNNNEDVQEWTNRKRETL